ncbi:hypothetical protein [Roseimaritima ulvae]|nr:hypothetical protein [Roseimaritima ulvae]
MANPGGDAADADAAGDVDQSQQAVHAAESIRGPKAAAPPS